MNHFLTDITKYALGWTLLHTLWQGAIIFGLTKILLSFISIQKSSVRYAVNCFALLLIIIAGITTFLYLTPATTINPLPAFNIAFNALTSPDIGDMMVEKNIWIKLSSSINGNMAWIITAWVMGVFVFSLRFIIGLFYIQQLKKRVIEVSAVWEKKAEKIAKELGIQHLVRLAESIHISKPLVLGYTKPIILLPIGLLSGLPASQIETILLHELTHVKRHDFLVNLIQSFIEVILFFNPFVWLISETIRKEREHCCDDQVVRQGSSRIEYIKALAQLEENQSNIPPLALALNKNKFHVFNRIKRIMETSANQNQSKTKPFILITLIIVGLLSASWLTIGTDKEAVSNEMSDVSAVLADTSIHKKKDKDKLKDKEQKKATYSRKVITTYNEDGTPREEIIENFEGDEELRSMMSAPNSMTFVIPTAPSVPSISSLPAIPPISPIPFGMGYSYSFNGDTTINRHFFSDEDAEKWEEFGREMEKRFEHFGADNEEFAHAIEEWANHFGNSFKLHLDEDFDFQWEGLTDQFKDMNFERDFEFRFEEGLKEMEEHLERAKEKLKDREFELKKVEEKMKEFESKLQEQLIKDGYLKKGEKVEAMNWGNGKLTVNGIKIKEEDVEKYEALTEKYFSANKGYYKSN